MPAPFRVREVRQASSGGSYVVMYQVDVFEPADALEVACHGVAPTGADEADVAEALAAVRRGAAAALAGRGARLVVSELVIHLVDFKPLAYERVTARVLGEVVAGWPHRPPG